MSPRFRRTVGRGIGYVARGAMTVGSPFAGVGRDIYDTARAVATPPNHRKGEGACLTRPAATHTCACWGPGGLPRERSAADPPARSHERAGGGAATFSRPSPQEGVDRRFCARKTASAFASSTRTGRSRPSSSTNRFARNLGGDAERYGGPCRGGPRRRPGSGASSPRRACGSRRRRSARSRCGPRVGPRGRRASRL
jgi:hypothetical protein